MSGDGYTIGRCGDGSLLISIDMQGTPWPYDALSWAAVLPGVEERIDATLAGEEPPLTLRLERTRPRRTTDLVVKVGAGCAYVRDLHAGVEHRLRFAAGSGGSARRRFRALASVVHAVLLMEGGRLQLSADSYPLQQRSEQKVPPREQEWVPQESALRLPAIRFPRRAHQRHPLPCAGTEPAAAPAGLEADEQRMSSFASTPNQGPTPAA